MKQDFIFACGECAGDGVLLPAARQENCLEVIRVMRGKVWVKTAMCAFAAMPGDLFFLPQDMVRSVTATTERAQLRFLRFSADLFDGMGESIDRDLYYMFLTQSRTRENRICTDDPSYMQVRRYFENCYDEHLTKELCYSLRIRGLLTLMMAQILASYSVRRENDRMVYHNVLRLRPTLQYIEEHYREKITVPQLAEMLPVTSDYYTKLFRDSIGKTTVDYINSVRLNRGMILLIESDDPIADVAAKCGLVSGNYFSKLFKGTVGITPLAYRKAARG